jgi:hypothetical protein
MEITNPKVASLEPHWAPFHGFSLLFNNPGPCLHPAEGALLLRCKVEADPTLAFFRALTQGLMAAGAGAWRETYGFCPLPPTSYHVTVWDGCNAANLSSVLAPERESFARYLQALPGSLTENTRFTDRIAASPLVQERDWSLRFCLDALALWGRSVLVVRLRPADPESEARLARLAQERSSLTATFRQAYAIGPPLEYSPHVSIGYFANADLAEKALPHVSNWDSTLRQLVGDLTLEFQTIGLYGFTDMSRFYRRP